VRGKSPISGDKNCEPTFVGTAPQSIAAQLEHQPTRESVDHAKKQAQAQILMVVTQAEALGSEGKKRNVGMRSPKRSSCSTPDEYALKRATPMGYVSLPSNLLSTSALH
jgi:hypothetical protein